jgi:signal transduction histidine kinase
MTGGKMERTEILIIEDNKLDRVLLKEYLKDINDFHFTLSEADTLRDGFKSLNTKLPDVILLDLNLPDSMALDTFFDLHKKVPNIPIIILTGISDTKLSLEAVKNGAQDYLDKAWINSIILYKSILYAIERQKLKNRLERSEELMIAQSRQAAMGDMIGMIAHQWRQPITHISMIANNLLADIELEELNNQELAQSLHSINLQVKHLSKTIDDFRNFFKPQSNMEKAEISNIIEESLSVIEKSLENNNIEIHKDICDKIELLTYPREITQVLLNIIGNAKEAIVENGSNEKVINLKCYKKDDEIIISIYNSGSNIKKENSAKVFEPYFTTKEKVGTGLGLYITKIIIEKHLNGKIWFENINNGICFYFTIPIKRVSK